MIDDFGATSPEKPASKLKTNTTNSQPEPASENFKTPDQVASQDIPTGGPKPGPLAAVKLPGHHWFNLPWPPNRAEIILSVSVLLIAVIGSIGFISLRSTTASPKPTATKPALVTKPAVVSETVPSTLSGLPVNPAANQLPVTGVMVENSTDARPQAGLSQAGVVFEAVAEAGITRFLALYQDQQPTNIGPIRSVRPYYLQWDLGFDAPLAHVGGSPDALADVKSWDVKDLNQFYNDGSYHRISSRPAPHNVYTGIDTLNQLETKKGYTSSNFTGFPRKVDAPAKTPTASSIDISLSSSAYNVHYDYVANSNSYNRSEAGAPQVDSNTGKQLSPKVVVTIVVPETQGALDSSGAYYSNYTVVGSGTAYVFQDGTVSTGSWSKPSATEQISFKTATGQALKLDAGQTWITAVTATNKVTYR